jgi:rSAM/selenodomain-associated transferase 1
MGIRGSARAAVAIMAKAPRPGEVKTRLCPPLTPGEAAALARAFVLDAIERLRGIAGADGVLAYAPAQERAAFAALAPDMALLPQPEGDLGQRMHGVLADLLARAPAALVMGTDTPTLPRAPVERAIRLLEDRAADVVLGPSEDGGYYLIGLRTPRPELFRGVAWSTPAVLAETRARARAVGLEVALLPPWFDVDTPADLARLEAELTATAGPEPRHTRQLLARRGRAAAGPAGGATAA